MEIRNIRCIVSYDGSKFNGWQIQLGARSVQEEIMNALFKIHKQEITIIGAGRTDKGVHGIGQVFNFKSFLNLELNEWKNALNANLPLDIRVKEVSFVDDDFHSRYNAKGKFYQYKLSTLEFNPIQKDYIYQYGHSLDIDKMNNAAKLFIGKHDFENFCSNTKEEVKDFLKEIYSFDIHNENGIIYFDVKGSGFLRYQVRMMVGSLIEIGSNKKDISIISDKLDKKEASNCIYNAPSCGLYLIEVIY